MNDEKKETAPVTVDPEEILAEELDEQALEGVAGGLEDVGHHIENGSQCYC